MALTLDQLIERRSEIITLMGESGGVKSVSVDGMSVSTDWRDELSAIEQEIARLRTAPNSFGLRFAQLVPPGGGG